MRTYAVTPQGQHVEYSVLRNNYDNNKQTKNQSCQHYKRNFCSIQFYTV